MGSLGSDFQANGETTRAQADEIGSALLPPRSAPFGRSTGGLLARFRCLAAR